MAELVEKVPSVCGAIGRNMLTRIKDDSKEELYRALVEKDSAYEGCFFFGVKSTGIFCRPTCPARKPRFENCEFFRSVQESLLAGYRACKRCRPLDEPRSSSELINKLANAVEDNPTHRWNDGDVRRLGFDPSTVRRQFKNRFGMTFIAFARARRLGLAFKSIRTGDKVVNAQLQAAYESSSGFRDAFTKILGDAPVKSKSRTIFKADWIDTPLGPMIVIADEEGIHLLEFTDRRGLEKEIEQLRQRQKAAVIPGSTAAIRCLKDELQHYFNGELSSFTTPLHIHGSPFQQQVMKHLLQVPFGETISYRELAQRTDNSKAIRAVASANGRNQIAVVIPCHRIIGSDGELRGYAGGLARKRWLIDHEAQHRSRLSIRP